MNKLLLIITLCVTALIMLSVTSYFFIEAKKNEIRNTIIKLNVENLKMIEPKISYSSIKDAKYQYIVFYDSTNCTQCAMNRMYEWNSIIEETIQQKVSVDFIFIFEAKGENIKRIKKMFLQSRFLYPIYIDSIECFRNDNPQVQNAMFHSMIIDKQGNIKMIGNATKNTDAANNFEKFLRLESNRK